MKGNSSTASSSFWSSNKEPRSRNKPYLNLVLGDKTGQIEGRAWELADPRIAKYFRARRHREGARQPFRDLKTAAR